MTKVAIPFDKKDIHYDSAKREVSLSVDKFDALVKFMQDLVRRAEEAEEAAGVFRYRMREGEASAGVLQAAFERVREQVRDWLSSEHTIHELAERAGIPYATCYRIVKERLEKGSGADTGDLQKIEAVVSDDLRKAYDEIGGDIVVLPRPGKTARAGELSEVSLSPAAALNLTEREFQHKLKDGTLAVKLVDLSTGKSQPVTVKDFELKPARRFGRRSYKFTGKLDFAKLTAVREPDKSRS
jgi:hypothetical protein